MIITIIITIVLIIKAIIKAIIIAHNLFRRQSFAVQRINALLICRRTYSLTESTDRPSDFAK